MYIYIHIYIYIYMCVCWLPTQLEFPAARSAHTIATLRKHIYGYGRGSVVQTCSNHGTPLGRLLCLQWIGTGSLSVLWCSSRLIFGPIVPSHSAGPGHWIAGNGSPLACRMMPHASPKLEHGTRQGPQNDECQPRSTMEYHEYYLSTLDQYNHIQSHTITISNTRHTLGDMGRCHLSELEPAIVAMNPHRPWAAEDASHLQFQMVGKSCFFMACRVAQPEDHRNEAVEGWTWSDHSGQHLQPQPVLLTLTRPGHGTTPHPKCHPPVSKCLKNHHSTPKAKSEVNNFIKP